MTGRTKPDSTEPESGRKAPSRSRARPARPEPPAPAGKKLDARTIRIRARFDNNTIVHLRPTLEDMRSEVKYWTKVIAHRRRFIAGQAARERQANIARATLEEVFGGDRQLLDDLAGSFREAEVLEIELAHDAPAEFFAMPWEYVLSAGLDPDVSGLVVRRLRGLGDSRAPSFDRELHSALYLECQAGVLTDKFHWFNEERQLHSWLQPLKWHAVPDRARTTAPTFTEQPTPAEIRAAVVAVCPGLVHVTGYDAQEVHAYLKQLGHSPADPPARGLGVADARAPGGMSYIDAEKAGALLCAGASPPQLIAFNVHRSAELALAAVRAGALAGLGRDGEWEDAEDATEQLHREIYRILGINVEREEARAQRPEDPSVNSLWPFTLLQAVRAGVRGVRRLAPVVTGTGIVLYTRASILDGAEDLADPIPAPRETDMAPEVELVADPNEYVNYAMLHNGRTLFQRLQLRRKAPGAAKVRLEIKLTVGDDAFTYEDDVTVDARLVDLTERVHIPLGWIEDRMPSECVRTSLNVIARGAVPSCQSLTVSLLPIDSWRDDDANRQWLPSFVLPRDSAVLTVLGRARSHLVAITDDPGAGFSGYQEPKRIDAQVRAIWTALMLEDFQYINPPPSYTLGDQRVRSPSRIFAERRGTCLDLALLMASCLEAVEIQPVLFLLQGHAFVGYWRTEEALDEFAESTVLGPPGDDADTFEAPWLFGASWYDRMRKLCREQRVLVPLEATYMTARRGFEDAVGGGLENLRSQKDFHSMLDVRMARDHRVTPLPILEDVS